MKMKILSFDVGIINLAYCIFDSNLSKITHWGIIDLCERCDKATVKVKFSAKVPSGKENIAKAANDIHINLIKSLDNLPFLLETDYVVIEKQPSFNPKMRIIGGCLQSYFYIRGVVDKNIEKITSIEFFSPKHKLKCYTGPELKLESKVKSKYAQTKKMGILIARSKLNELNETNEFKQLFETSKKKDDLADCYLQAITFCLFKKFTSCGEPTTLKRTAFSGACTSYGEATSTQNECEESQTSFSLLNKTQIKKQFKEHFDQQFNQGEKDIEKVFESMDPQLKQSIVLKFGEDYQDTILDKLSMKSYKSKFI